jgi:hypothetical protein
MQSGSESPSFCVSGGGVCVGGVGGGVGLLCFLFHEDLRPSVQGVVCGRVLACSVAERCWCSGR